MKLDHTHDPEAISWVSGANEHPDFPVQNLPLGVFSSDGQDRRIGCAIGDRILDLAALSQQNLLPGECAPALQRTTLNELFNLGGEARRALRHAVFDLLSSAEGEAAAGAFLMPMQDCQLHLPFRIGDYTDFYVGIHHATNIGSLFRPDNPLLPNYKHVPIGYHGRSSSIRPSGHPVIRPSGQIKSPDEDAPSFMPSKRLDYELELGVWLAGTNPLGEATDIADAWDRVGGMCLLNDWSARDIQAWEYQPLGPFLAKNFLSTVSPWVVTAEALAPFRIPQPARAESDPEPLPYLRHTGGSQDSALSLNLEVWISSQTMRDRQIGPHRLSRGPASNMYWTVAQMIAHHTSNGCNLQSGDLLGTGTISGPEHDSFGSLIELSSGGKEPVALPSGETRTFLEDGDELVLTGRAEREGYRSIGFGFCGGVVQPAR